MVLASMHLRSDTMSIDAYTPLIFSGCAGRVLKSRVASAVGPLFVFSVSEDGYEKVNAAALDNNWAQLLPCVSMDRPDNNILVAAWTQQNSSHSAVTKKKLQCTKMGQPRGRQAQ